MFHTVTHLAPQCGVNTAKPMLSQCQAKCEMFPYQGLKARFSMTTTQSYSMKSPNVFRYPLTLCLQRSPASDISSVQPMDPLRNILTEPSWLNKSLLILFDINVNNKKICQMSDTQWTPQVRSGDWEGQITTWLFFPFKKSFFLKKKNMENWNKG